MQQSNSLCLSRKRGKGGERRYGILTRQTDFRTVRGSACRLLELAGSDIRVAGHSDEFEAT
eukprot:scaffold282292_cov26-Prasinocladus_malaysianus.AAC.1